MKIFTLGASISTSLVFSACSSTPEFIIATPEKAGHSSSSEPAINQSSKLHINDINERVAKNNPQLRAARFRIDEAQGQVTQSGLLANPELGLELNKNVQSSEGGISLSFAQRFPITNRLSLEKRISQQQLDIAKGEVKTAQRTLITDAQDIAVEILHNRQRAAYLEKQSEILSKFAKLIEDSANEGVLSPLDANQAKVEAVTLSSELAKFRTQDKVLLSKLKAYIGLDPTRKLELVGQLPATKLPKEALVLGNRSEYRTILLQIQESENRVALAKANKYQDIEGSIFTSVDREEDAPEGIETEGTIGVGVSIPLQLYNKNEGNIKSARAYASRISREKEALALLITQEVVTEREEMKGWLSQAEQLSNNLLPLANDNAEQLEKAYRDGQAPFTSVLKARNQQLALQSQNIDNLESFYKARVRYYSAIGREGAALK